MTTINGKTPKKIKKDLVSQIASSICRNCPHCLTALELIEQLERERDAAVEDLTEYGKSCETCLHERVDVTKEPCISCAMISYRPGSNWQWRGVKEVRT